MLFRSKDIKKELDDNVSCHQALGVYMHFYKQIQEFIFEIRLLIASFLNGHPMF